MNKLVLRDVSRTGVYCLAAADSASLEAAARESALGLLRADVRPFGEGAAVLGELGRAFAFPDWYGANFDALHDCLTDPEQENLTGSIVFISGLATLRAADPESFATLIEVFRSAAESNRAQGRILWIVLDVAAPDIPPLFDA